VFILAPTAHVATYAGKIEDAKEEVRKNPDDADAHFNLGNAYYKSGRYKEAIESYKQAIRIDPDCGVVYNLGGGRENSASVLECIYILEKSFNYKVNYSLSEKKQNW
jgi:tetratricopeptide (TPR) repeat protein